MRVVPIAQNTPDWQAWRATGIGASDAGALMGCSPWSDVDTLYRKRTGTPEQVGVLSEHAMAWGHANEWQARAWYIGRTGLFWQPLCTEDEAEPYIKASLDGYVWVGPGNPHPSCVQGPWDPGDVLEIKCPQLESFRRFVREGVPPYYVAQCQQQLFVTKGQRAHFVVWPPTPTSGAPHVFYIDADPAYQARLYLRLKTFWESCILGGLHPLDAGL